MHVHATWVSLDILDSYFRSFTEILVIKPGAAADFFSCVSLRVRQKQNKYPILFLSQGITDKYTDLMDIRCQSTQIAISFAQSENILVSRKSNTSPDCLELQWNIW